MPLSDLHKKKLKTNLAILAAIAFFCAMVWAITMIRMGGA